MTMLHIMTLLDGLKPIAEVARALPGRGGRPVHVATVHRWIQRGVVARDGRTVKLKATQVGARMMISDAAIEEFLTALNASPEGEPEIRSPNARRKAVETANEQAEQLGY